MKLFLITDQEGREKYIVSNNFSGAEETYLDISKDWHDGYEIHSISLVQEEI